MYGLCVLGTALCLLGCRDTPSGRQVNGHAVWIFDPVLEANESFRHGPGTSTEIDVWTYSSNNLDAEPEDEVLTVNGQRYVICDEDDTITIRYDKGEITVEFNGRRAEPEDDGAGEDDV
jgi:hypothetical protein